MPTTRGTGRRVPAAPARTTATLSCPSSRVTQDERHVTLEQVADAYYDCRRHKRSKRSAVEYEMNYELENVRLCDELNAMTYRPGTSIVFCVTRPKLREVFAASFRDRIVHHLFIGRILPTLEARLSDCACSCRKDKGTLYGARRVCRAMREHPDGWYVKFDIEGFFMSIDKQRLMPLVESLVREAVTEGVEWWLWLARTIVMHRPELDCERRGDLSLFDRLPANKTLFKTGGRGVPIGNLPSQILTLLFLADFCRMVTERLGDEQLLTMYADDGIAIADDKRRLLRLLNKMRTWLREERGLMMHPRKVVIQRVRHGVMFTGYRIGPSGIRPGRRVAHNAAQVVAAWSSKQRHTADERSQLRSQMNSYLGLLRHTMSYRLRRRLWRMLGDYDGLSCVNMKRIIITNNIKS